MHAGCHFPLISDITPSIVSMLTSSAVDRGFENRSGETKDYKIGICCFSAKHTAFYSTRENEQRLSEKSQCVIVV
jgi:hypothetical protein